MLLLILTCVLIRLIGAQATPEGPVAGSREDAAVTGINGPAHAGEVRAATGAATT